MDNKTLINAIKIVNGERAMYKKYTMINMVKAYKNNIKLNRGNYWTKNVTHELEKQKIKSFLYK